MPKRSITYTEEFAQAVEDYQLLHNLKTWSEALLTLAALGYEQEAKSPAPAPYAGWGGWRGSETSLKALMEYADKHSNGGQDDPTEAD